MSLGPNLGLGPSVRPHRVQKGAAAELAAATIGAVGVWVGVGVGRGLILCVSLRGRQRAAGSKGPAGTHGASGDDGLFGAYGSV